MANMSVKGSRFRDVDRESKILRDSVLMFDQNLDHFAVEMHQDMIKLNHNTQKIKVDVHPSGRGFPRTVTDDINKDFHDLYYWESSKGYTQSIRSSFEEQTQKGCTYYGSLAFNGREELIPFDGSSLDLFDWGDAIEGYFVEFNPTEAMKCKIAASKLEGIAHSWWNEVQNNRVLRGKHLINSWDRMRRLLIHRFAPNECSTKCPFGHYSSSFKGSNVHKMSSGLHHEERSKNENESNEVQITEVATSENPFPTDDVKLKSGTEVVEHTMKDIMMSTGCLVKVHNNDDVDDLKGVELQPINLVDMCGLTKEENDGEIMCMTENGDGKYPKEHCYLDSRITALKCEGSPSPDPVDGQDSVKAVSLITRSVGLGKDRKFLGQVLKDLSYVVGSDDGKTYGYSSMVHRFNLYLLELVCGLRDYDPKAFEILQDLKGYNIEMSDEIVYLNFDPGGEWKSESSATNRQRKSEFLFYFESPEASALRPLHSFYGAQISVSGFNLLEKLEDTRWFVVDSANKGLMSCELENGACCALTNESEFMNAGTRVINFDPGGTDSINKRRHCRDFDFNDVENEHLETENVAYSLQTGDMNGGPDCEAVELKLKQKMTFEIGVALLPHMSKRYVNVLDNYNFKVPRVVWKNVKLEEIKWMIRSILTSLIIDEYMVSIGSVAEIAFLIFDPGGMLYKTRSTTLRLESSDKTIAFNGVPLLQRNGYRKFDMLRIKAANRRIFLLCPCVAIWTCYFADKDNWIGWSVEVEIMPILSLIIWSNNANGGSLLSKIEHIVVAFLMTTFVVAVGGMGFDWNIKPIGAKVLVFILDCGKPCAHFTTTIVEARHEVIHMLLLTYQKSEALRTQLKLQLLSVGSNTAISEISNEGRYVVQLKLSNKLAVNCGLLRNEDKSWVMRVFPEGGGVAEDLKRMERINVAVCTWNEGRYVVQVEIIFVSKLEYCSLESTTLILDIMLGPMAWLQQLICPQFATKMTAVDINYTLDEHFRTVWLVSLFHGVFVQMCNLQKETDSNLTRGRVIAWVCWNDEDNVTIERKFKMVEISVVITDSSCVNVLSKNEQSRASLKLFHMLVNGLDPPMDVDDNVYKVDIPSTWQLPKSFNMADLTPYFAHNIAATSSEQIEDDFIIFGPDGDDAVNSHVLLFKVSSSLFIV